jgi:hypothetical protein
MEDLLQPVTQRGPHLSAPGLPEADGIKSMLKNKPEAHDSSLVVAIEGLLDNQADKIQILMIMFFRYAKSCTQRNDVFRHQVH